MKLEKIGLGGGCHWCTEAVFQHLNGVEKVEQGWISSTDGNEQFSEAVIVHFDLSKIDLKTLIHVHLLTHKSTSDHSMRKKYRAAIYTFNQQQKDDSAKLLVNLSVHFEKNIVTQVLPFKSFEASRLDIQNYYLKNPKKPFCTTYIDPKLKLIKDKFRKHVIIDSKIQDP